MQSQLWYHHRLLNSSALLMMMPPDVVPGCQQLGFPNPHHFDHNNCWSTWAITAGITIITFTGVFTPKVVAFRTWSKIWITMTTTKRRCIPPAGELPSAKCLPPGGRIRQIDDSLVRYFGNVVDHRPRFQTAFIFQDFSHSFQVLSNVF